MTSFLREAATALHAAGDNRPAVAEPASRPVVPVAPPAARDEEIWGLANRVQSLHRSVEALRGLMRGRQTGEAPTVAVRPRVQIPADCAAVPVSPTAINSEWWPSLVLPDSPLVPAPGLAHFGNKTEPAETVACSVVGLRGPDLEAAVARVSDEIRRSGGFKPVFLSDSADLSVIVRQGFVVEYLPPSDTGHDTGEVGGFPEHRLRLLRSKWNFTRVLDFRGVRAAPVPNIQPMKATAPSKARARRPRAAVVSWDLGHNPAGRAMVLYDLLERDYDVELIGPLWSRFGTDVWAPIRNSDRRIRSFRCHRLDDFWPQAVALAANAEFDLVVVCKPRLPGLVLGAMIQKTCDCPMVLDIDDFELSFFNDETSAPLEALESAGPDALAEPYLELATRVCDGLIHEVDARIVSNIALLQKYGGHIVRHARDETVFDASRFDRAVARRAMGMSDYDFALVFVGTIRRHKGIIAVAKALHDHPDKRFVMHLVGEAPDQGIMNEVKRYPNARIVLHPPCEFEELPARLAGADGVVLLQDPSHPISRYQVPAKVSDASALGLPLLATDVLPLRDLALTGIVRTVDPADLQGALNSLLAERQSGQAAERKARVRAGFEAELGLRVNRERMAAAIDRARRFGSALTPGLERLIALTERAYLAQRQDNPVPTASVPALAKGQIDIVMFWKQNDTGLYGRRSDMLMKHLLASGRVRRVLHLDAPMRVRDLERGLDAHNGGVAARILRNAFDNQHGLRDRPRHLLRTYLWDDRRRSSLIPGVGCNLAQYPDYVAAQMELAGIKTETAVAWVCPVVFDFPQVAQRIPFRAIVGDLIDDQRSFAAREVYRERIIASYNETLPLFDLTFTNCQSMLEAFGSLAHPIHVVPNGTEPMPDDPGPVPKGLGALTGPVAGYVGNLRDRFDWDLLAKVARLLPGVQFPIIGGGAREEEAAKVHGLANVHLLGVVPHEQVAGCLARFDVALVPHERSPLTSRMNPLKIYSYFAARKPIVATEVDNVDKGVRPFIRFARDPQGFAAAITDALCKPPSFGPSYDQVLDEIQWEARIKQILTRLDDHLGQAR